MAKLAHNFGIAQVQLDKARASMDAVENRLTNATALPNSLQQSAAAQNQQAMTRFPSARVSGVDTPRSANRLPAERPNLNPPVGGSAAVSGAASSSHSPDGQLQHRNWGPEQVLGPPDTHQAGDMPTAWAPRSSVGTGEEWLHVNYDRPRSSWSVETAHGNGPPPPPQAAPTPNRSQTDSRSR